MNAWLRSLQLVPIHNVLKHYLGQVCVVSPNYGGLLSCSEAHGRLTMHEQAREGVVYDSPRALKFLMDLVVERVSVDVHVLVLLHQLTHVDD